MREVPSVRKRREIVEEIHLSSGHVGVTKLYRMCRSIYFWNGMINDCIRVVEDCVACSKMKLELRPLPLKPTHKFA